MFLFGVKVNVNVSLKGFKDGTGCGRLAVGAMIDEFDQYAPYGLQIGDAGIEVGDLDFGQDARLISIPDRVQSKQLPNLIQCETQPLRPTDKA